MTTLDPFRLAVADGSIAVSATGALAVFNEVGVLGPLDVHAAMVIARLWGETDEHVILAAALVVRGTRSGHVCIRLATQREAVVVDGQDPEIVDALPWPDPALWEVAVAASALVGDGSGDEPLVLLARDTRESGPAISTALAEGLTLAGMSVLDLGVLLMSLCPCSIAIINVSSTFHIYLP